MYGRQGVEGAVGIGHTTKQNTVQKAGMLTNACLRCDNFGMLMSSTVNVTSCDGPRLHICSIYWDIHTWCGKQTLSYSYFFIKIRPLGSWWQFIPKSFELCVLKDSILKQVGILLPSHSHLIQVFSCKSSWQDLWKEQPLFVPCRFCSTK